MPMFWRAALTFSRGWISAHFSLNVACFRETVVTLPLKDPSPPKVLSGTILPSINFLSLACSNTNFNFFFFQDGYIDFQEFAFCWKHWIKPVSIKKKKKLLLIRFYSALTCLQWGDCISRGSPVFRGYSAAPPRRKVIKNNDVLDDDEGKEKHTHTHPFRVCWPERSRASFQQFAVDGCVFWVLHI